MDSTVTITELQGHTPKIVRETEHRGYTAISRSGKIVAFVLSKDRMEALIETMDLMNNPQFISIMKDYKAGKLTFKEVPNEN
jgi:hypothetical protein